MNTQNANPQDSLQRLVSGTELEPRSCPERAGSGRSGGAFLSHVGNLLVVRDDLLAGGTKEAALADCLGAWSEAELVYAGPRQGYAQIALAAALNIAPPEVWSVAGSGTLQRGLQRAWPLAKFYAVQIGKTPDAGRAEVLMAPEKYEQDARIAPPFPSCSNYDAKAWRFLTERAGNGALFWNVAA